MEQPWLTIAWACTKTTARSKLENREIFMIVVSQGKQMVIAPFSGGNVQLPELWACLKNLVTYVSQNPTFWNN